jgi:hypothetical protein
LDPIPEISAIDANSVFLYWHQALKHKENIVLDVACFLLRRLRSIDHQFICWSLLSWGNLRKYL